MVLAVVLETGVEIVRSVSELKNSSLIVSFEWPMLLGFSSNSCRVTRFVLG